MTMKLLLVEDVQKDIEGFIRSVESFNEDHNYAISVETCNNIDDALRMLNNKFDGAIIDMKLGDDGDEGNRILKELNERNIRMPIVILTGTPDAADKSYVHIDIQKKGNADNIKILEDFRQIHASGLTKVMGGRGLFEKLLGEVYKSNILHQKEVWKKYGQMDSEKSERALMRHVLNHLINTVDLDEENVVPEEFYIYPPMDNTIRTGSLIRSEESGDHFMVMNPMCDLTLRDDGEYNARQILLCKVSDFEDCFNQLPERKQNNKGRKSLEDSLRHNKKSSYHALPETQFFKGGFLDFESLLSVPKELFQEDKEERDFGELILQIAPAFSKDIVARFSTYYGRQGQPTLSQTG